MEYKIRHLDWFKRRVPTKEPRPIKVEITNIELVNNSYCNMTAEFDDGNIYELTGRVNLNDIKNTWTVHGTDPYGHQCFVDVRK